MTFLIKVYPTTRFPAACDKYCPEIIIVELLISNKFIYKYIYIYILNN